MHTHFASGPTFIATGLNVLIFFSAWRLIWHHVAARSTSPLVQSLAAAALYQG